MSDSLAYLWKNKEWIFSGIGVAVFAWIIRVIFRLTAIRRLSEAEQQILVESAQEGEVCILKVDAFGQWVRAGKKDFFDQKDRAVQARYLEALESLHRRGLVRHESHTLYRLTHSGFEIARRQAKRQNRKATS